MIKKQIATRHTDTYILTTCALNGIGDVIHLKKVWDIIQKNQDKLPVPIHQIRVIVQLSHPNEDIESKRKQYHELGLSNFEIVHDFPENHPTNRIISVSTTPIFNTLSPETPLGLLILEVGAEDFTTRKEYEINDSGLHKLGLGEDSLGIFLDRDKKSDFDEFCSTSTLHPFSFLPKGKFKTELFKGLDGNKYNSERKFIHGYLQTIGNIIKSDALFTWTLTELFKMKYLKDERSLDICTKISYEEFNEYMAIIDYFDISGLTIEFIDLHTGKKERRPEEKTSPENKTVRILSGFLAPPEFEIAKSQSSFPLCSGDNTWQDTFTQQGIPFIVCASEVKLCMLHELYAIAEKTTETYNLPTYDLNSFKDYIDTIQAINNLLALEFTPISVFNEIGDAVDTESETAYTTLFDAIMKLSTSLCNPTIGPFYEKVKEYIQENLAISESRPDLLLNILNTYFGAVEK